MAVFVSWLFWKTVFNLRRSPSLLAMIAFASLLAGCTDAVEMRNAATGQVTQCGPFPSDMILGGDTQSAREARCVQDFQRQGYEREP